MIWLVIIVALIAAALAGYGLKWAIRRAGRRGWIYTKENPRPRGAGTLGLLEQIYQPSMEHVIEERSSERIRADQDESGDNPH